MYKNKLNSFNKNVQFVFFGRTCGLGGYTSEDNNTDLLLRPLKVPKGRRTGFWEAAAATPKIAKPANGSSIFFIVDIWKQEKNSLLVTNFRKSCMT